MVKGIVKPSPNSKILKLIMRQLAFLKLKSAPRKSSPEIGSRLVSAELSMSSHTTGDRGLP